MYNKLPGKTLSFLFKGLPLAAVIIGSVALTVFYFLFPHLSMPILPETVTEMVNVPLRVFDIEISRFRIETENYLLFQRFESLPPEVFPNLTLVFGLVIWLLMGIGLSIVSFFNRIQFVISMGIIIFLLTLTGVNGLNIGGANTNLAMIILLSGFVFPAIIIHTFFFHWTLGKRIAVILPVALLTLPLLILLGETADGKLWISEHLSILGMAVATLFMLYIGHAVISSLFVLLTRLNKGVGLKISWHISLMTLVYLLFFLYLLLRITGNTSLPIPMPPVWVLFLLVGLLGFFETKRKIEQIQQPYAFSAVGEGLYLIGFAVTVMMFWKADFSANRPMADFLQHVFIYTQLAFSLLFYAYLMANFNGLMDQGGPVDKVLFKPKFFAYYHMRIGAMLALLSVVVFADGIVGVQMNAASTNVTADYYYATRQTREASILYEYSWERYRRNEKAINTVAHLALAGNQPTVAMNTLLRSYEKAPTVNDILLLSASLQQNDRYREALTLLESGLSYFPENVYLLNNVALLYSKAKRGEDAFDFLDQIDEKNKVAVANKIGLQAKHLTHIDLDFNIQENVIGQINQMAFLNLKGGSPDFSFLVKDEWSPSLIDRAVLRNHWSSPVNKKEPIGSDLQKIDSLLANNYDPSAEQELRETRVVRTFQQDYINESLKHLNGLAYSFPNAAAHFHWMAGNILISQFDFEKAAIELKQAEEKGFSDFRSQHLPILFFGGLEEKAWEVQERFELNFPEWMEFNGDGELISNDTTTFFSHLARLNTMVKGQFLSGLQEIHSQSFTRFFAYQILLRKSHWLGREELEQLIDLVEEDPDATERFLFFEELKQWLIHENSSLENGRFERGLDLDRNAYWTPLVLEAMEQAQDNLEKYNILLEASAFNKDPLLWIGLVKYSRLVGVEHYASSTLEKMTEWVDPEMLIELQLQNL